jgi:hypothetical protein
MKEPAIELQKIIEARVVGRYQLELKFENGVQGTVDLSHLCGRGVFTVWDTPGGFEGFRIGDGGELVWADEIDLCPQALYLTITGDAQDVPATFTAEHSSRA